MAKTKHIGAAADSLGDAVDTFKSTMLGAPGVKDICKATVTSVKEKGSRAIDAIAGKFTDHGDNIYVIKGTQTCLGKPFETLYSGSTGTTDKVIDGVNVELLDADTPYDAELHNDNLRASAPTTYGKFAPAAKVAYEMSLLTKKYEYEIDNASSENDKKTKAEEYANIAAQYRQYCADNDFSWERVVDEVSCEFQIESADAKQNRSASDMLTANKCHSLILQVSQPEQGKQYSDTFSLRAVEKGMTYEDTLTTDPEAVEKLAGKGEFAEKWSNASGFFGHGGLLVSSGVSAIGSIVSKTFTTAAYGMGKAWSFTKSLFTGKNKAVSIQNDTEANTNASKSGDKAMTNDERIAMATEGLPSDSQTDNQLNY